MQAAIGMIDTNRAQTLIKEHMPVVGSEDAQIAMVDHLEGADVIKLTKDPEGKHHYIPLAWVSSVDDKVHLDRPCDQVMTEWATSPADAKAAAGTAEAEEQPRAGTTEETSGQQRLIDRVLARKQELEAARDSLGEDDPSRRDIEVALSNVDSLLTGDLKHVPGVVSADLAQWLERNKHLAQRPS